MKLGNIRNGLRNGAFGLAMAAAGCIGGGSDAYSGDGSSEENAQAAITYVEQQLQSRGYTVEENVNGYFLNVDNGQVIANEWDLHAYNGIRDSYWEATGISIDVGELATASINHPASYPNLYFGVVRDYSKANLDSMVLDSDP